MSTLNANFGTLYKKIADVKRNINFANITQYIN